MPQSLEAAAEALELMAVPKQIITPQSNRPVIGLVQDTLLGSMLLTKRDVFLARDEVMNLCMWINNFEGRLPVPVGLSFVRGDPSLTLYLLAGGAEAKGALVRETALLDASTGRHQPPCPFVCLR